MKWFKKKETPDRIERGTEVVNSKVGYIYIRHWDEDGNVATKIARVLPHKGEYRPYAPLSMHIIDGNTFAGDMVLAATRHMNSPAEWIMFESNNDNSFEKSQLTLRTADIIDIIHDVDDYQDIQLKLHWKLTYKNGELAYKYITEMEVV